MLEAVVVFVVVVFDVVVLGVVVVISVVVVVFGVVVVCGAAVVFTVVVTAFVVLLVAVVLTAVVAAAVVVSAVVVSAVVVSAVVLVAASDKLSETASETEASVFVICGKGSAVAAELLVSSIIPLKSPLFTVAAVCAFSLQEQRVSVRAVIIDIILTALFFIP